MALSKAGSLKLLLLLSFLGTGIYTSAKPIPGRVQIRGVVTDYSAFKEQFSFIKWIVNDPIIGEEVSYPAELKADGSFQTEFPLSFSQDIMMKLGEAFLTTVFACSGDSIYITLSANELFNNKDILAGIKFSGKSGLVTRDILFFNNVLQRHPSHDNWNVADNHVKSDDPIQYLAYRTDALKRDRAVLDSIRKAGSLSADGAKFLQTELQYGFGNDLMRYTWLKQYYAGDDSHGKQMPDEYLAFATQSMLKNKDALLASTYGYDFLKEYESYQSKFRDNYHSIKSMVRKWRYKDWSTLTKEQQNWVKMAVNPTMAGTIRQYNKTLQPGDSAKLTNLVKVEPAKWAKSDVVFFQEALELCNMDISYGEPDQTDYLKTLRKEYGKSIVFDVLLAQSLYDGIQSDFSSNKAYAAAAIKEIRNKPIRARIQEHYETALAFSENPVLPKGSNVHDLSSNPGDSVLSALAAKFPDKALYLDFWATWCGPCLAEMQPSQDLRKTMKDRDVVFVYLCSSSPENTWKQTISKINLEGEHIFLTSKQTEYLYNKFGISGIPHYIVVNRKGDILFKDAKRPSSGKIKEQLAEALK